LSKIYVVWIIGLLLFQRGCPALHICIALVIWVAFFKQPDALPGRAHPKNKNYIFLNYFWFICDFLLMIFIFYNFFFKNFFGGCFTRQCGLFQKTDPNTQCWTSHLISYPHFTFSWTLLNFTLVRTNIRLVYT
jgi:hypothetical protein